MNRCEWEFYAAGKGTLAPWSPPQMLVVTGVYRFSLNPMYVAVILAFHLRVVFGEELWLARRYGRQSEGYRASVPRWFGPL